MHRAAHVKMIRARLPGGRGDLIRDCYGPIWVRSEARALVQSIVNFAKMFLESRYDMLSETDFCIRKQEECEKNSLHYDKEDTCLEFEANAPNSRHRMPLEVVDKSVTIFV